ncbi:MAG: serine/threonine protein kinase, partial [Planctomycetaceae bacterium]|nr:serine/threonine protein kinase [Planctomycetaceae bacterium]
FHDHQRSTSKVIQCGIAVANALCAAHEKGLVHGDVTPRNVLMQKDGTFLLTDFGFARLAGEHAANGFGGTPGFLAPEQISDSFGAIGPHTDVYGLGGLIYSISTGEPPTRGNDLPEILAAVLSSKGPAAPGEMADDVPRPLNDLLLRCLQKEPRDRPQTVAEVLDELLAIQSRN